MYVVLGATGHVGSAAANALLQSGKSVTIITRDEAKATAWRSRGAEAAVVDVADVDALRVSGRFSLTRLHRPRRIRTKKSIGPSSLL